MIDVVAVFVDCNSFLANVFNFTPESTKKTQSFPGVFRWYKMGALAQNGLKIDVFFIRLFSDYTKVYLESYQLSMMELIFEHSFRIECSTET